MQNSTSINDDFYNNTEQLLPEDDEGSSRTTKRSPLVIFGFVILALVILVGGSLLIYFMFVLGPLDPIDVIPGEVTYWHNYNKNGKSAWAQCTFQHMNKTQFLPTEPPIFTQLIENENTTILSQTLLWLDPDYTSDWHTDPVLQLNIISTGIAIWQNEDYEIEVGPGDFYLGNDQGTKGHISYSIGEEPLIILTTQLERKVSDVNNPCWL